jgi:hypothetical protein
MSVPGGIIRGVTRSRKVDEDGLAGILAAQHDVIARGQALGCGLTEQALRHRIRLGGAWRRLLPGVYLTTTGAPTFDQYDMAALLYGGARSVITGTAALNRYGLRDRRTSRVDLLVPAPQERKSLEFVRVRSSTRMPRQVCRTGPIQFALVPRAVADTARELTSLGEVRAVVSCAVQRRRCTVGELRQELACGPAQGSALYRSALAQVADGVRSAVEGDFRTLVLRSGLPEPMFNPLLFAGDEFIAQPDAWWPEAGIAGEVDSREYHLNPEDWERTNARDARMAAHGIVVLHCTPIRIREASALLYDLAAAIASGQSRPRLPIRAVPASQGW